VSNYVQLGDVHAYYEEDGAGEPLVLLHPDSRTRGPSGDRNLQAHGRMLEDIETAHLVTTINVLRRIVANLGGNSDLP
jgi:hypothetical protein